MNKFNFLVVGVATLVLTGCTLAESPGGASTGRPTETEASLVGNDADEHGCIGSAGYSWCEAKAKCLRPWEEPCDGSPTTPTVDETEIVITQIKDEIVAKRGSGASNLEITVAQFEGDYAKGGAAVTGEGGGMWFGAKVNGDWKLVWDGNGIITCEDLADYEEFPASMVPECFNTKTNKLIKR